MRKSILAALAVMAVFSASAFAQATLETLMTHSVSSAVGTHAGTVLGRATNTMANRVAQQTSTATSHVTSTVSAPRRAGVAKVRTTQTTTPITAASTTTSGNGSLIASIQGGEPRTRGCTTSAKTGDTKTVAAGSQSACAPIPRQTPDHPSVVNLPAPQ